MFAARQFLARGRVSVRPRFVAARVAPIGAVRHFSGNPMDMIQAQLAEATAKLQEIAKEPQQMIQPHLVSYWCCEAASLGWVSGNI